MKNLFKLHVWSVIVFALLLPTATLAQKNLPQSARPEKWAQKIEKDGLPNFHQVSQTLYRGAQPTEEGFRHLKAMGVKTVINLRSFHSDRKLLGNTQLGYERIWMKAWHPEEKELVRFLQIATDPQRQPVFVHCQAGADRTGTVCAIYRIVIDGWSKEDAIKEMREGGFGHWDGWDLDDYIRKLDVEALKAKLKKSPAKQKQ